MRQVIWLTLSKQDKNRRKAWQHDKILSRFNHFQWLTANYALFDMPFAQNYFTYLHESQWVDAKRDLELSWALLQASRFLLKRAKDSPAL